MGTRGEDTSEAVVRSLRETSGEKSSGGGGEEATKENKKRRGKRRSMVVVKGREREGESAHIRWRQGARAKRSYIDSSVLCVS